MELEYDSTYELNRRLYPFYIRDFKPFQVTRLSLDDYIEKRTLFTDDDWRDVLIQSTGFNPDQFSDRERWLFLLRLVPFVESNYNLIELGPRETGKTYTYRNTSKTLRAFVISGGSASPATLFYNQATRKSASSGRQGCRVLRQSGATLGSLIRGDDQRAQRLHADGSVHSWAAGIQRLPGQHRAGWEH